VNSRFLTTGVIGSVATGLCCFTPVLSSTLVATGLASWMLWLDFILLPLLAIFVVLLIAGVFLPPAEPRP
jgi:mercuric ion transport protein